LKPRKKFADTIKRHRNGIAAYRQRENKVALGLALPPCREQGAVGMRPAVQSLNNKI
jgi:hypothetical protein